MIIRTLLRHLSHLTKASGTNFNSERKICC